MTQQPEYIGCMDGRAIVVRRQADEILLTFDGVEARLSIEAAIRLANLLPSVKPSSSPSNKRRRRRSVQQLVKRRSYPETIADLIEEDLIKVGTVLTLSHYNVDYFGTVTTDGKIDIEGHKEKTPSAAGQRAIGRTCNGWQEWRVYGGSRLTDLRWMLRAKRFPGENHGYAESTAHEENMLAMAWVDYALARGLDPGKRDNTKVEAFLTDRQRKSDCHYAESTLNAYRMRLRHWFDYYDAG